MGFATYEFYTNTYYGDLVSESDFSKWDSRANDKLLSLCGENLTDEAKETYETALQKAECAVMDILFKVDYANSTAGRMETAKSMSAGGQSVTFADTAFLSAITDKTSTERLILDTASDYLGDTGLLCMEV